MATEIISDKHKAGLPGQRVGPVDGAGITINMEQLDVEDE